MTLEPHSQLRTTSVRLLFGATLGLAAALLFWQQLMLGRELLPVFGSVPTVWLVSLVVFQTILLAGYAAAHFARSLPRVLTIIMMLLVVGLAISQHVLFTNFASLGIPTKVDTQTVILALLGLSGASLFLLSMISPLLQHLYAGLPQPDAKDPYFLYSASNFGSFAGLLIFPLLLEPIFGVSVSRDYWFAAAVVFVVLLNICLMLCLKPARLLKVQEDVRDDQKPAYLKWLFYSFMPCALSFGATSHLISDIAPLPLLSMVPLGLYLLTFVLAFSRKDRFSENIGVIQIFLIAFYIFREVFTGFKPGQVFDILLVLAVFFFTAWRCHRELARLRPSPKHLTGYYLTLALGGALGGIFNVFVIPFIMPLPLEFALFLLITLLPNWKEDIARIKIPQLKKMHSIIFGLLVVAFIALSFQNLGNNIVHGVIAVFLVLALMLSTMLPSVLAVGSVLMIGVTLLVTPAPLAVQRDFFGVKRVMDRTLEDGIAYRTLLHGTTSHGMQQRTPSVTTIPYLYYAKGSGLNDAIATLNPQRVGIVGLGMGAVACIPDRAAQIRFFEIDAGVEMLARKYFTFLSECPADVVIGDARMTLREDAHRYDMLIVDAFSSDAIPVHLLTQEMFKTYADRMDENGLLVLHISNRFLNLRHVIAGAQHQLGWKGAYKAFAPPADVPNMTSSEYVVLSRSGAVINKVLEQKDWASLDEVSPLFWTDDHISIIPILNFGLGK